MQLPPSGNGQDSPIHPGGTGYIKFQANDAPDTNGNGKVASGIAALRWSYDPTPAPGWGWVSPTWTPKGASASIAVTGLPVTATHWGTNIIYVQAQDRAGNLSATVPFSFYVPWAPTPLAYGDVSGDGRPDILVPDLKTGDLLDYSQALTFNAPNRVPSFADSQIAPRQAATAAQAPRSTDGLTWNDYRVSHRGAKNPQKPVDDLIVHKDPSSPGAADGSPELYYLANNKTAVTGQFTDKSSDSLARPKCVPTSTTDCTKYKASMPGWESVSQITPVGSDTTTLAPSDTPTQSTGLLAVQDGNLWYYPANNGNATVDNGAGRLSSFADPAQLTTDGTWGNYDLIIPGDALNTANPRTPTLWVRARASVGGVTAGNIYQYALKFVGATNASGPYTTIAPLDTAGTPPTLIGSGVTVQDWPIVGAASLTSDDVPDLWARGSTTNQITTWAGVTDPSKPGAPVVTFTRRNDQWTLSQTKTDANNFNNLTTTDPVSWGAPLPSIPGSTGSLRLDGGMATAVGTAVDTKSAYTVSAWVKLDNVDSYQTFVSQAGTNTSAFYLQYNKALNAWTFLTTSTDSSGATQYIAHSNPQAVSGNWTHLVGTYTPADTKGPDGSLTLYVNGDYAGSAGVPAADQHSWSAPGPLTIGAVKLTGGSTSNQVHGNIADVRTYPYVLTKEQVKTIYNNQ
ncbi:hypothetical protein CFP65_4114 [Kitasatospora sp. MMS16-BH015]|uniref:LamG-like jellyroll fold domain-containing protein n=1 Tax=Kitasatospora sp. MMS16-BH015 TaxID=2018025 RepID=UPI000CA27655|nr:LamG-like jellyroll fold domain-containing protein [Kitasatospora sp. MMS16-BH015]AUG78872.1 hypothetical protein CFP65_4114 [Kitasatospora sp. MMS16-BH015]